MEQPSDTSYLLASIIVGLIPWYIAAARRARGRVIILLLALLVGGVMMPLGRFGWTEMGYVGSVAWLALFIWAIAAPRTKRCPACALSIPYRARLCPHCRTDLVQGATPQSAPS